MEKLVRAKKNDEKKIRALRVAVTHLEDRLAILRY